MQKNKSILLFFGLFAITALLVFAALIKNKVPDNIFSFMDIGTHRMPPSSIEVNRQNSCGQSFVSNFNGLFMMSVFIPKQDLDKDGELVFHLRSNDVKAPDLARLSWKFREIHFQDNSFYIIPPDRESTREGFHFHFSFTPIWDSSGKEFYFYFESLNTGPGDGIKLGVWDNVDYYEALTKGEMSLNYRPINGFLAFRTYNTWQDKLSDVFKVAFLRLRQDLSFSYFYTALIFSMFFGLILCCIVKGKDR